ncbi:uncharacterized protein LOC123561748 [Mercenaria mercenaria]|uniref:uncharacterized protein LOC123561748 n=1 Tax=Mercenaria mercenaria TaxID=6596 RepID=UPI00234E6BC9|nr:uncharacterized protein LOC123561748 [Mercenaria mercenaria]
MLAFVFVVFLLAARTTVVYSLNFTLSMPRVVLGVTGKLFMSCNVTEKDVSSIYLIQIRREKISGWDTIAKINAVESEYPTLCKGIVGDKDFIVGGMLDKEIPPNTHLTLDMNILTMTLDDAGVYRCEMSYINNITGSGVNVKRNATLLIEEAENKTEGLADISDNAHKCIECDTRNSSVTVGAILGVTNILTILYAAYLTVVIRRSRSSSFGDGSLCHGRREP